MASLIVNNILTLITKSIFHLFWLVSVINIKEMNTCLNENEQMFHENARKSTQNIATDNLGDVENLINKDLKCKSFYAGGERSHFKNAT